MVLLTLDPGTHSDLEVRPRWPSSQVRVDVDALAKLHAIQAKLPPDITLILTRGFEEASSRLGYARKLFRFVGVRAFGLIYPSRRNEVGEIFGSNGHNIDGTHVDISFRLKGRRARLLPFGVFTPVVCHSRRGEKTEATLAIVKAALEQGGFEIHANLTESMQIHCDMIR